MKNGGQIRINDHVMSTIAGDLVTTTASTATSINYAGQSQLIADGKLDVAATGQTGDYHLEERTRYRIQDTESIQSLWSNGAWTETSHPFTVDHGAHDAWIYNQTVDIPKNSDPIITTNPDGSTSTQINKLGQDQSTVTSAGGYDYHLIQSGSPTDFVFSLNLTSQSQSGKHDTGTWRAADGTSGATHDNLGTETKNSRANLSGRVQNGSVYYTGIDVYQTRNTSTNNTGSGFALGQTTNSHTVGSTQTTESRGGNSASWYGSKLESGNSTTNYTTVSGTMGQPFSGMTQTGFNMTTLYGTAAQTGITGMYGSYGQTGTGTTTPFTNVLADGEPPVSTPGGTYLGSDARIVSRTVTPVGVPTSQLRQKIVGPGNGGETLGPPGQKNLLNDSDAYADLLRQAKSFPVPKSADAMNEVKKLTLEETKSKFNNSSLWAKLDNKTTNEEELAKIILRNKIKKWRKNNYNLASDFMEYFLSKAKNVLYIDKNGIERKKDYVFTRDNEIELPFRLREYLIDIVKSETLISGTQFGTILINGKIANENFFHVRWFSEDFFISNGQKILKSTANEKWIGTNDCLFNTFGGANLKVVTKDIILAPDLKTADFIMEVTINNQYTFPSDYFNLRLIFDDYRAANLLEFQKGYRNFEYSKTLNFTICEIKIKYD